MSLVLRTIWMSVIAFILGFAVGHSSPKIEKHLLVKLDSGYFYETIDGGYLLRYQDSEDDSIISLMVSESECTFYPISHQYLPYIRFVTNRDKTKYQIYV